MWPNPQETADLVTFTEQSLMKNFIFSGVNNTKQCQLRRSVAFFKKKMWTYFTLYSSVFIVEFSTSKY